MDRKRSFAGAAAIGLIAAVLAVLIFSSAKDYLNAPAQVAVTEGCRNCDTPNIQPAHAIRDRVINLPEDGGVYYLSVFTTNDWHNAREQSFIDSFAQDQRLSSLKAQTHYRHYLAGDVMYRAKFANVIGDRFPAVVLTDSSGQVVSKYSGSNVPGSGDELAELIAGDLRTFCSNCPNCPKPKPQPAPAPAPSPSPSPSPPAIPDTNKTPAKKDETPLWLYAVVGLVGAGAGAANEWRKTYSV